MTIEWESGLTATFNETDIQSAISDRINYTQWSFREHILSIEERKNKLVVRFQLMGNHALLVEQALRSIIGNSIAIEGISCPIRLYIGSYFRLETGHDELDIVKSNYALQIAKSKGRGRNYIIAADQAEQYGREIMLESDLFVGLKLHQFRLDLQPIYQLDSGRLVGFEALVRWEHPQLGLISPLEFIPLAEQSGAIVELGEWIIAEACQQLQRIQQLLNASRLHISINVSPVQLKHGNIVEVASKYAANYRLEHRQIQFELTESSTELVNKQIIAAVKELHSAGFLIAIDDFGTGYACLETLSSIPISCVKLDKQFIHNMESKSSHFIVVKHVIAMLRELDVYLVAEGIETAGQYKMLAELGCNFIQGYYMSRPIPAAQLEEERLSEIAVCLL